MKKFDEGLFDKRTVRKNIERSNVTEENYKEFLRSLPDDSKNADKIKCSSDEHILTFSSVEKA